YYVIGFQSYCQGKLTNKILSNYSKSSVYFSFNLINILDTWLDFADGVMLDMI
ncbi:uncharacterized protein BO96DRAFT_351450, partial [Aspergillus niger CBS 101883]|uniref:uncharacterized protein n=1 Tax=Aspergillus lacticoffeatus (strain CBS 101883) TaxID=1450533 RepID=UPI000D7FCD1E